MLPVLLSSDRGGLLVDDLTDGLNWRYDEDEDVSDLDPDDTWLPTLLSWVLIFLVLFWLLLWSSKKSNKDIAKIK